MTAGMTTPISVIPSINCDLTDLYSIWNVISWCELQLTWSYMMQLQTVVTMFHKGDTKIYKYEKPIKLNEMQNMDG